MPSAHDRQAGPLMGRLYRQGAYRWLLLVAGAALLSWLWVFAGQVREAGGVKRPWAVLVSRLLVVTGGIFVARLLLFSHEERVPVLLLRSGDAGEDEIARQLRLISQLHRAGYEDVPIGDIVMFIREHRYVPKRAFGLVVEVSSKERLPDLVDCAAGMNLTALLPSKALEDLGEGRERAEAGPVEAPPGPAGSKTLIEERYAAGTRSDAGPGLPDSVCLGVILEPEEDPRLALEQAASLSLRLFGKKPDYAMIRGGNHPDLNRLLKSSGYTSLFDGNGYNRFGDDGHRVRLFDVTALVRARVAVLGLLLSITMFKGTYLGWPLVAIGRLFGILPGEMHH
jgi:hypothetical protein